MYTCVSAPPPTPPAVVVVSVPRYRARAQARPGEIRCPNCGTAHRNPALKDIYRYCHHCLFVMRDTEQCPVPDRDTIDNGPALFILIASCVGG